MDEPSVVVAGDALLDVIVMPQEPMRRGSDVPASVTLEPGGQGANIAVRLSRRGVSVRLACALGNDAAGDLLRERMRSDGVSVAAVPVSATGSVVVLVEPEGGRTMLSRRVPFESSLDLESVAAGAGWLVVSGYLLLEGPMAGGRTLAARRAVAGCALGAGNAEAWARAVDNLEPDVVVLNENEAEAVMLGAGGGEGGAGGRAEAAARLAGRWEALVVVTHAAGASAAFRGELLEHGAEAHSAVDSTGAGDAYAAALIAALVDRPWPPDRSALEGAMADAGEAAGGVARTRGAHAPIAGERVPSTR